MKNFIISFDEKVGSTPLVQILNNVESISIVHQDYLEGWEPFDRYNCGRMSNKRFHQLLNRVYSDTSSGMDALNRIYQQTAKGPLVDFGKSGSIGFKMRFMPLSDAVTDKLPLPGMVKRLGTFIHGRLYRKALYDFLAENHIVTFIVVRQDVLRWALSKYHGGGGVHAHHIQFALAGGKVDRDGIGKITVDLEKLKRLIDDCIEKNCEKFIQLRDLRRSGVEAYPVLYEEFSDDKPQCLKRMLDVLDIPFDAGVIDAAIASGSYLKKVHSKDLSSFVENHEEVEARFGDVFTPWYHY